MKTFTKKRGIFVAAAALLMVTAMLVTTWCSNDISNGNYADEYTPPPGKGAVRLSFNNEIDRTILPDNATLATFTKFDFVFTANGGGATDYTESNIVPANLYNAIALDPGNYNLKVIAYIGTAPAATNDPVVAVVITAAKITSATIQLKPYDQTVGTGNGTFKYKINSSIVATDLTSAVMNLTKIGTAGTNQSDINISSAWNDGDDHNLSVKAGDYYLDFVIIVKSGETVTFRHIVHIYQNMTSSYEFTINPDYFNAVFKLISTDLTYEHPQDKLPVLSADGGSNELAEGEEVVVNQGSTVTITVTNGTDFASYEWYSQDATALQSGTTASYVVNAGAGQAFNAKKTYLLTVVGVTSGGEKYYTFIKIKVVAAP